MPPARRVLIVEHDESIRRLLALVIGREGYDPVGVASAAEAVALIDQGQQFELIVLDYTVPGSGAPAVAHYLNGRLPETLRNVIVITGAPQLVQAGLPDRSCTVPARPFVLSEFLAVFRRCAA